MCEEKQVYLYFRFATAVDLNKRLKQIKLPISPATYVPISDICNMKLG